MRRSPATCTDTSFADTIVDVIRGTIASSYTYKADSVPPDPVPADIDMTPLDRPPRYCQVRSCTFHNNRRDIYPNTRHGMEAAEAHDVYLHHHLYTSLSTAQLQSIGWLRCCDLCPTIHMDSATMETHRERCITYFNTTSLTRPAETTGPFHHLRTGRFATLYLACPPNHIRDLDNLILENTSQDPVTLFAIVHGWHTASQSIMDNAPTATTTRRNEQ